MALDPGKKVSQYVAKIYDLESGLPANLIYAILQDTDGYLWLGTQSGLVRFDGFKFEIFTRENTEAIRDNDIRALYQDSDGVLWIGTNSGGLTCYKDGDFVKHYPVADGVGFYHIWAIGEDRGGNLWIGSYKNGIHRFKEKEEELIRLDENVTHQEVRTFYKDGNGDLWASSKDGVILILPDKDRPFHDFSHETVVNPTVCLYDKKSGILWIGTGNSGLFRWNIKKNGEPIRVKKSELPSTIVSLYKDRQENLWIGTDGKGLIRLKDDKISKFPGDDGLGAGYIYSILEDKTGSLWVGAIDEGLHRIRDGSFSTFSTEEGLVHKYVNCVLRSTDGKYLWAGTNEGLSTIDLETGSVDSKSGGKIRLRNETIVSLYEESPDTLLIGTTEGLRNLHNGMLTSFTLTKKDGLTHNQINCIIMDRQGYTWLGTEKGLNRWDRRTGQIKSFLENDSPAGNEIEFFFRDSRGTLWVGTNKSLHYIDYTNGNTEPELFSSPVSPKNTEFRCAYEDKKNILWFGSNSGLLRHDPEHRDRDFLFTVNNGRLKDNYVHAILEDDNEYLWLGGQNGVSRIKRTDLDDFAVEKIDQLNIVSFSELDGMRTRWCTTQAVSTGNKFWFPTAKGVALIDPNNIKIDNIITDLSEVDFLSFEVDGGKQSLTNSGKEISIPAGKKLFEFHYGMLNLKQQERVRFRYRLVDVDKGWKIVENPGTARYPSLEPGHFTFEIEAYYENNTENTIGEKVTFYLRPYITQTLWFYVLLLLAAGLSVYFAQRFRVMRLKAREKELAVLVDRRTSDLKDRNTQLETARHKIETSKNLIESKNSQLEQQTLRLKEQADKLLEMDKIKSRFFANISHEFRTPLTLIMGPLEQMITDVGEPKLEKKYNLMLRNSQRLLGLINQLLELSRYESGNVKIRSCYQDIVPLLKGFTVNFENVADQQELELEFNSQPDEINLYLDAPKIEDIMDNLLINAVKFTPRGGKVTVSIKQMPRKENDFPDGYVQVTVSDTGRGIPKEQLPKIFNRFYQSGGSLGGSKKGTGIGLALVKELVQLHYGRIDVYSREGKGTEFIIQLPLGKSHLEPGDIVETPGACEKRPYPGISVTELVEDEKTSDTVSGETREPEFSTPSRRKEKEIVLVVEDSADVREYIRGILEPEFEVLEAKNGERGLKRAYDILPDIIISDIMMPGIDGCELCSRLKKDIRTSHIPIILLTAKASEESILQGLETGADDYITKPFNGKILVARTRNLIELRRQLHASIKREMTLQPVKISMTVMDEAFMMELKETIDKNLSDPDFNVEQLSKNLMMDRSTVYRKIMALTGETPTEFIRSCRLKRGAELLKGKIGSVLEVAFEVGFSSANYFTKCFKQKFHQLPTTYRESQ